MRPFSCTAASMVGCGMPKGARTDKPAGLTLKVMVRLRLRSSS